MSRARIATIPQMEPWFDQSEANAVYDYMIGGGWVTEHSKTRQFEAAIAEFTGAKHCSVVPNGTLSLSLALMACGVGPGDEVLVPDFTMVASANAARLIGAEVVFADVEPQSLCMDYPRMCEAVTPRTRAVILVTINGRYPKDLEQFVVFCRQRALHLIEDAAQSLGSFKGGRHLGTFGAVGCFSFSSQKVITTGQGGALVTDDAGLFDRMCKLRDFGRPHGGVDCHLTVGWNFKFTDLQAVVGLEQMKKLAWRLERKKQIYALYQQGLSGVPGIALIPTNLSDTSPWFMDVLVADGRREDLSSYLQRKGIGTRPFYPALHSAPAYDRPGSYPIAERISREGLWLPSSSRLSDEEVHRVSDAMRTWAGGRRARRAASALDNDILARAIRRRGTGRLDLHFLRQRVWLSIRNVLFPVNRKGCDEEAMLGSDCGGCDEQRVRVLGHAGVRPVEVRQSRMVLLRGPAEQSDLPPRR